MAFEFYCADCGRGPQVGGPRHGPCRACDSSRQDIRRVDITTDHDTVPVRRETLRVLVEGAKRWHDYTVDWRVVPDQRYSRAVREAEAQLRGEEHG